MISNFRLVGNVVFFLSGDSLGSEFRVLTFQNTLSVPIGHMNTTHVDGTDNVFRNVGTQNSDAGVNPKKRIQHGEDSYFKALFQATQRNKNCDYRIYIQHNVIH